MGNALSCVHPQVQGTELVGQPAKSAVQGQQGGVKLPVVSKQADASKQNSSKGSSLTEDVTVNVSAARTDKDAPAASDAGPSAFVEWARGQAASEHKPLEAFISDNIGASTSSSAVPASKGSRMGSSKGSRTSSSNGRASLDAWSSLFPGPAASPPRPSASLEPYQPHNAYLEGVPRPPCEEERVATANGIQRMRALKNGELESILCALCAAFGADTSSMTLLTGDSINVCAACGVLSPGICPDRWGFCGWSFINTNHELLVVEDLREDARFADNFFVVDPAYALLCYFAAPLISSDGHRLGTLCVMGQQPRKFDATRAQFLANMTELLVRQLERSWVAQLRDKKEGERLARSLACYNMAYMLVDVAQPDWRVLYMNGPAQEQLGVVWALREGDALPTRQNPTTALHGVALEAYFDLREASTTWAPHCCEFTVRDVQGAAGTPLEGRSFMLTFRLATSDGLDPEQPFHVGIPSYMDSATDGFGRSLFFMHVSHKAASSCGGAPSCSSSGGGLSSWSATLSAGESSRSFVPRGVDPKACPIEGLVMGPLLGKGSYGRVYRGVHCGVPVAVKLIEGVEHLRTTADGEPLEAVLTQGINHLGIMRTVTYAYSPDKQSCWLLFEYCDRSCVQDAVVRGWFRTDRRPTQGGVDLRTVAVTAYEIASAMAFLHKHDIVHGDLKGGNVLLSSSSINPHGFTAKVGDFGLARHAVAGPRCSPNMYGTVTHMPPEVLLKGEMGKPTDVYSFGVMLWEMLTGSRAWAGMRHTQIICQVALLKRMLAVPTGLPPVIARLLARCMARDVASRCTFEEVLSVLSDFLQTTRNDDLSNIQVQLSKEAA